MRVYLNGVLDGTTSQTGPISDSDAGIEIGRRRGDFIDGVIDEVRISAEALGAGEFNPLPASLQPARVPEMDVARAVVYPNPIRETDTLTVDWLDPDVRAIRIAVYQLSGKLLYTSSWAYGNVLEWSPRTEAGDLLANGFYILVVYAAADSGRSIQPAILKFAVLR